MTQWRHAVIAALIAWAVTLLGHSAWAEIGQNKERRRTSLSLAE